MEWEAPPKPAELAENRLIAAILSGRFAIGSALPAERELARQLGVTRPTLREALQRMARDGWLDIHHGRPTRVQDYWQEGNLGVLSALASFPQYAPQDFAPDLLAVRLVMAPVYARRATACARDDVIMLLRQVAEVEDRPDAFASADWQLHHRLTVLSGNPIFTLILNGFKDLYASMARVYFQASAARSHSRAFYTALMAATLAGDLDQVETVTRTTMAESLDLWRVAARQRKIEDGDG